MHHFSPHAAFFSFFRNVVPVILKPFLLFLVWTMNSPVLPNTLLNIVLKPAPRCPRPSFSKPPPPVGLFFSTVARIICSFPGFTLRSDQDPFPNPRYTYCKAAPREKKKTNKITCKDISALPPLLFTPTRILHFLIENLFPFPPITSDLFEALQLFSDFLSRFVLLPLPQYGYFRYSRGAIAWGPPLLASVVSRCSFLGSPEVASLVSPSHTLVLY